MQESRINILLVEDSPTHARIIRDALQERSRPLNLTLATTLSEARRLLAETTPDLVLCDFHLPDGKGTELLPQDPAAIPWPLIILTGQGDEQVAVEVLKAGALDYVAKSAAALKEMPHIIERSLREWRYIRERKEAAEEATRFGRILDASLNEIYTFDTTTLRFIQVNRGALENLGYTLDEVRELTPLDLKLELTAESFARLLAPLQSGEKESIRFCTSHQRKDGSLYPVEAHIQISSLESSEVFVAIVLDITERVQAEEALRFSDQRFSSVFQTAAAGMVIIAPDGRLLQVNPVLCRLLGYEEKELLQLNVLDITHPEDREATQRDYSDLVNGRCPMINREKRYLRKDGQTIWGHVSIACVSGKDGTLIYCVGLVQDITERKRDEEKLLEINRELDAFVRTVSHDLRTPLTPIIGYAQFLKDYCSETLDPTSRECLDNIEKTGQRMLALLEDLLTLSQVGHLESPRTPVAGNDVVQEVLQTLAPRIAKRGLQVEADDLSSVPVPRTLLVQIFANLIGNAISYGGAQGGTIEVGERAGGGRVAFYVRDHGPGIPEGEREHIFEVFYRGTSGKKVRGTGVGLATVRRIANRYGGKAWVEETPGGGSTFWVELPHAEGEPPR